VIEIAKGFGMNVLAFDTNPDGAAARRLGFRYAGFGDALAQADVLTLHVPSSPATVHLVSDREFAAMKPGAILINTARRNIVDTAALVRALKSGRIRAAGLDVLPQERSRCCGTRRRSSAAGNTLSPSCTRCWQAMRWCSSRTCS
jgi:D-lactate dehydrogenase